MLRLDLQFFSEEKTEKATPKKRQDTRKKGQVAKSMDISTAFSLLLLFLFFMVAIPWMGKGLAEIMVDTFNNALTSPIDEGSVQQFFTSLAYQCGIIVAPLLLAALVIGIFFNLVQVGFLFSTEAIAPKFNRLNPISGIKRIYSVRAIVEFLKSMLKIVLVGLTTFFIIWIHLEDIINLTEKTLGAALVTVGKITIQMGVAASILLIFLAILDLLYQRYDHEKNIRMSKKEVKDEHKKTEGDPQIKSKIRERQRMMATRRMMQEVPNADVVITNPTHFAVALKYEDGKMDAPRVVAKGADEIAQKIKEIARLNDVVIMERRELARALYHQLEIGDPIPENFFKAVAEILAYVYQLKEKV